MGVEGRPRDGQSRQNVSRPPEFKMDAVSASVRYLGCEPVVCGDDYRVGTKLKQSSIRKAQREKLRPSREYFRWPIDLGSFVDIDPRRFQQQGSPMGRGLADEVGGFGQDMRRGEMLGASRHNVAQQYDVAIAEGLYPLEFEEHLRVRKRNQPQQQYVGIAQEPFAPRDHSVSEYVRPSRAPKNSPSSALNLRVL